MKQKLNHAKYKRDVAATLYAASMRANPTPSCVAVFERPIRDMAMEFAKDAISKGYSYSKTQYAFFCEAPATRDIFLNAASKLWIESRIATA